MLFLTAFALAATLQASPPCLHSGGNERPEQAARRRTAVQVARLINSAEGTYASHHGGKYGDLSTLIDTDSIGAGNIAAPNFSVKLDLTEKGFWFSIADDEDSCGFRVISNENGVIFQAEPIR